MLIILFFIFSSNYTRYYLFKKTHYYYLFCSILWCSSRRASKLRCGTVVVGEQASYDAGHAGLNVRLTSPAYAGVRAGVDVAGGGRTRRGALQTWRPGALPGGRRGGAGGRGGQRC